MFCPKERVATFPMDPMVWPETEFERLIINVFLKLVGQKVQLGNKI